jgi:lactate permease
VTTWYQNYNPLGYWPVSTLISALPVLTLFFVLLVLKKRVWVAALSGMGMAILLALMVFGMPVEMAASSCLLGFIFGFLRIAWIIIASIFLYNIAVETGQFQIMKDSIAALSSDMRLQVILIAFCFGAFLEGTGGGGAPVAISGAFLIGLGFPPFQAATVCLLANTAPVAWGGVGNPIRALVGVTGLSEPLLNAMTGRILPPLTLIIPFWLVRSMVSWKQTREVWPALAVSGLSFAGMQYYWSNHQETNLVDIVAAIFSLLVMVAFLKIWKPKSLLEVMPLEAGSGIPAGGAAGIQNQSGAGTLSMRANRKHSVVAVLKAWSPFMLVSVLIFIAGMGPASRALNIESMKQPMPFLHQMVMRVPPVVPTPAPEAAIADLNILSLPGTAIFVGAALAALLLGMRPGRILRIFVSTFAELVPSLIAISFMVGLAFVTRYSGMDTVLGLSLTRTGMAYPFFGTLLGWLGVALTGTDAGSNALFGNLQKVTAEQLGVSPVLMASANSAGGVMGKMISAQSIVVSSAATQQVGKEAAIFKAVFIHSIVLASLVGLIVTLYAFVIPWIIPR